MYFTNGESNRPYMTVEIHHGDLLDQKVDAIVNAWNRNIIPWWLLLPQGVSGAIKRRAGLQPFHEIARVGPIPLGNAIATSAGKLPFQRIIHVAGINGFWRASEYSIRQSVRNAMAVAEKEGCRSVAFPVIGSGSGSFRSEKALEIMMDEFAGIQSDIKTTIVVFRPKR
jgi:O-acetyl-ADP-ribose deacetylase (regulator of RNase III)